MKEKAPQLSEAFIERNMVFILLAGPKGLEPSTSGLTGRRSNQLNYDPKFSSTSGDFSLYINPAGMTMIYPTNSMMGAIVRL